MLWIIYFSLSCVLDLLEFIILLKFIKNIRHIKKGLGQNKLILHQLIAFCIFDTYYFPIYHNVYFFKMMP